MDGDDGDDVIYGNGFISGGLGYEMIHSGAANDIIQSGALTS
ncbi:hypothetical protein KL86PLE_40638 [uncultured Pleomorphomonas sp.]|uniref:Uncharacterized protein n=1 Tax=uncultured Pleomorphomonas sp. TaxID=442121 RepID=A0A212LGZ7_9HYPH|nr:hypothetical protein [uncultured Pleomorphomonas sp.]SCM76833.1 hypothetical protein KL86PLE_40638 [uncultured Pleomorphomonas sp.]